MKELKVGETDKESCKGCFFDSKKFCEETEDSFAEEHNIELED